ncbi:hypothetical protein Lal_00008385 [Lupinus albus]|nr:hypothetical protein Lal_00008385 [Lupinus albus]
MNHHLNPLDVTQLPSWGALSAHREELAGFKMRQAFQEDGERFKRFTLSACGLLLDFSKNLIREDTLALLVKLAEEAQLGEAIKAMFQGEVINASERRPVLHTALRRPIGDKVRVDGKDVMPEVHRVLHQMTELVGYVHNGLWRGYTEKPITDVVNIGIGGSFLGPQLVSEALLPFAQKGVRCHYLANIDGSEFRELACKLNAETTLFIVSSKSFGTLETLKNAQAARAWYLAQGGSEEELYRHFIAVSSNKEAAMAFGIREENIFPMWDWVGGRYSLWSAIGLPIAMSIGISNFKELLSGAYSMDQHFQTASFERNIPVILALLGVWYGDFWGARSHAILPYDYYLPAGHGIQRQDRAPGRQPDHRRYRPGDLGWRRLQRPARLPPAAAPGQPPDPRGLHRPGLQLQPGRRPPPMAVRQLPVAEPGDDARQVPRGSRERAARQGPGRSRGAAPGTAQGDPRQPPQQHPGDGAHQPPSPGRADRHVRTQGLRAERALGHQRLRPVGRGTGQGTGQGRLLAHRRQRGNPGRRRLHPRPDRLLPRPSPRLMPAPHPAPGAAPPHLAASGRSAGGTRSASRPTPARKPS